VADVLYFNQVHRAQHWYTPSAETMVLEVKHVLQTGLQVQPISRTNALPHTFTREEAMWKRKKAMKVSSLDHETIMEEASKRDRQEYDDGKDDDDDKSEEESDEDSKEKESESESK